jgi:hypothetical protein
MDTINMNEAQLRASINRQASGFAFTPEQARGFNIPAQRPDRAGHPSPPGLPARHVSRGWRGQEPGRHRPPRQLLRNLKAKIAEATAQKKAFDALPEQRMKSLTSSLFADGGMAFGARILGASLITTGIFATINAAQEAAKNVAAARRRLRQAAGDLGLDRYRDAEVRRPRS